MRVSFVCDSALRSVALSLRRVRAETEGRQSDEIIQKFAAKEAEFAKARENYTYRQSREDSGTRRRAERYRRQVGDGRPTSFSRPTASAPRKWCAPRCRTLQRSLDPGGRAGSAQCAALRADHQRTAQVPHPLSRAARKWTRSALLRRSPSSPRRWSRASATSKARSGWTIAICRSSRPTARASGC